MIKKEYIATLVDKYLGETDMFLVKLSVGQANRINVYIDGDTGVGIDDCVALSRHIESHFDRDEEDYELNVSSAGIGEPLLLKRQYVNRLNKAVEILLKEGGKFKALLLAVNDNEVTIAREIKNRQKKGRAFNTDEPETISLDNIKHTKEIITI